MHAQWISTIMGRTVGIVGVWVGIFELDFGVFGCSQVTADPPALDGKLGTPKSMFTEAKPACLGIAH